MYFPYLRGRQFELLALRELAENSLVCKHIIPIIEPVKLSPTLVKTLECFIASNRNITVIHNPQVGNFKNDVDELNDNLLKNRYIELFNNDYIIKAHILNKNSIAELNELLLQGFKKESLLTICCNRDCTELYKEKFENSPPRYSLIPNESAFKHKIRKNKVMLSDRFVKQNRNTDYANTEDEFFSDDHLFYTEDGFIGYSDYSIIGEEFSESGFAPFAVAIHIVYFDSENNLRIRHFVSNTNEDINDPAGKFYEALKKLADWQDKMHLNTLGMEKFIEHYKNGTYPGLGTVKKLSIMHHIELVSKYLDGVQ